MEKDLKIFLKHILESVKAIENYTEKVSKEKFVKDTEKQDAIIRRVEIIGEAARNIPAKFKEKHREIEWREIIGMRDKLIHEYFGVSLNVVWDTVKNDIPKLKKQIKELL